MFRFPLALFLCCELAAAQGSAAATRQERPAITVIGASLSHGLILKQALPLFGISDVRGFAARHLGREVGDFEYELRSATIGFRAAFRKLQRDASDAVPVRDLSNLMFFQNPEKNGALQLKRAGRRTGLVLGLDFVFWFGYGATGKLARPGYSASDVAVHRALWRLDEQSRGLALLEKHLAGGDHWVVLGDYPDVTGAVEAMLHPSWIPSRLVREKLNARLRLWAAKHDQVLVYPLSERMQRLREGRFEVTVEGEKHLLARQHVFQLDDLHPNKIGVALILSDMMDWIRQKAPEAARLLPRESGLVSALRALGESESFARLGEIPVAPGKAGVAK